MVRLCFVLLAAVQGARIQVDVKAQNEAHINRGLEVLELLKESPEDVALQEEYSDLLGEVEWTENRIFLETGMEIAQEPVQLGSMTWPGQILNIAELLHDRVTGGHVWFGRSLTNRRDYIVEDGGEFGPAKYAIDGQLTSLHNRMHVFWPGEEYAPRYILRRAFNYMNPISREFGQFVYRVIQCVDPHDGECSEGDILYTITKDRLGRGALWGRDEYRVFVGSGGCGRFSFGLTSCRRSNQVLYALGASIRTATFDTDFYTGDLATINGDGETATIWINDERVRIGPDELETKKVAHATKTHGLPRAMNWIGGSIGQSIQQASNAGLWSDAYRLRFEGGGGPVDDLLISLLIATQDLTRDTIAYRNVHSGDNGGNDDE